MTLRKLNWLAAACMAALTCTSSVQAQESETAGIVRISDGRARTQAQPASFHNHSAGEYQGPGAGYGCPTCYGKQSCWQKADCCWFKEHYCSNSPDHGYSPPAKYPLLRRGVQYNQYFPNQWYGAGAVYAGAPVVYQPTDTTQLGYTYQHVPFWQPANVLPQRPIPAQWHNVAPPVYASRFHGYGSSGYGYGNGGYGYGNSCPYCQQPGQTPTTGSEGQPTLAPDSEPAPVPEAALPPEPRKFENSAASGHIRRAGF